MNRFAKLVALSTITAVLSTGLLYAQEDHRDDQSHQSDQHQWNAHDHDHYVRHDDWRRGRHLPPDYWQHAERVQDWRAHHLRQPPRGYEWREVDGNYVLAAVATGIIASVIAASAAH